MTQIKVLGIGSPFGDDLAGWKVIERLKQQLILPKDSSLDITLENLDRPGLRLIEWLSNADTVFLIDAVKTYNEVGTIHKFSKNDILESESQFSSHDLGVLEAVQLAEALNILPKNLFFYGIGIDTVTMDSILSEAVQIGIEKLAQQLKKQLELISKESI